MDPGRPFARLPEDERLMLLATVQEIVERGIALREEIEKGPMLVFPSELRSDAPEYPREHALAVAFRFDGSVRAIYATLAVRPLNSLAFEKGALYRNAAVLRGPRKQVCGSAVDYPESDNDATGRLTVFFDPDTEKDLRLLFLRYINRHLERMALKGTVTRERIYQCACTYVIPEGAVGSRRRRGETTAICPDCGLHLPIDDLAEESAVHDDRADTIEADAQEEQERQKRMFILAERERGAEYHVFLCHNSKDKPDVGRLAGKLRDQGILPWIDEEGILPGAQFIPELERIIEEVPAAAIIVGPNWMGRWQKQEYYAFLQQLVEHRAGRRKRLTLIPVLLPGAPVEPELPAFLRGINYVDLRGGGLEDREQVRRLVRAILSVRPEP
jgi:hypothetical protein